MNFRDWCAQYGYTYPEITGLRHQHAKCVQYQMAYAMGCPPECNKVKLLFELHKSQIDILFESEQLLFIL